LKYPLVYLEFASKEIYANEEINHTRDLRPLIERYDKAYEINYHGTNEKLIAVYNCKKRNQISAILSLVRTLWICFILMHAVYNLTEDVNQLLLWPMERMIVQVN
jgi:hypothetical protein